jgi:hydroxymethylbilane synthase
VQADEVRVALVEHTDIAAIDEIEVVPIRTTGDRIQDRRLLEIGGKGLFTKEIEEALFDRRIDLAVHSSKDMPAALPEGLGMNVFVKRQDPRDAWLARDGVFVEEMEDGAAVGTGSLRRAAQLLRLRPDLNIVPMRGNLDTRLAKLEARQVDATLLAVAGLVRLARTDEITAIFDFDEMVPAPGQGAIGIETRLDDQPTNDLIRPIDDPATAIEVSAERACLATLQGDCRTPVGILARLEAGLVVVRGRLLSRDGGQCFEAAIEGPQEESERLGREVGAALLEQAGPEFMESLKLENH